MNKTVAPEIRFWRFVQKTDTCWEWIGGKTAKGYGAFFNGARPDVAHRFSWELFNGPIPDFPSDPRGLFVCHHCDNRACVNPDHLFLGTNRDNTLDMCKKGRHGAADGENNGRAKLTWQDVRAIREAAERGIPQHELARKYGMCSASISNIVGERSWRTTITP